jgi:hypothetical protein
MSGRGSRGVRPNLIHTDANSRINIHQRSPEPGQRILCDLCSWIHHFSLSSVSYQFHSGQSYWRLPFLSTPPTDRFNKSRFITCKWLAHPVRLEICLIERRILRLLQQLTSIPLNEPRTLLIFKFLRCLYFVQDRATFGYFTWFLNMGWVAFPDGMVLDCPCSPHRTIKQNCAARPVQISCDSCSFSECARWVMDSFVRFTEPETYITFCKVIFRSGKRNDLNFESCDDRTSMKTWWILALWRFSGPTTFSFSGPLVDSIANSVMKTCIHIISAVQEDRKYLPGSRICELLLPWDFANRFGL